MPPCTKPRCAVSYLRPLLADALRVLSRQPRVGPVTGVSRYQAGLLHL